jgi:alkaline phosphatase D
MQRRDFLSDLARYAFIFAGAPNGFRLDWRPRYADDPFTLGVASGDPTPAGGVIWTRLAPRPFEPEGGMVGFRPIVSWEVAEDDAFTKVVRRGRYTAAPELGYSIHVELDGLASDQWYHYRFQSGDATSQVGRLRTTPAAGATTDLRFGMASCQNYEQGLFTAIDHLSRENLDLVAHLGDYIYEYGTREGAVRKHHRFEVRSVEDYRERYAQYKQDPALQAAHRMCPWLVTWDDHEVDNNYASAFGENRMESEEQMLARRAAGYQAWWEHQPVRVPRARSWADLDIRRTMDWGALARFWVMDTRQYRSDQSCEGTQDVPCGDWADPARTMLGAAQEQWIDQGLASARHRWQVLAQQVMVAPYDDRPEDATHLMMNPWSGYPAARDRLLGAIARHAAGRTVVLTGDIHSNWVNDLHAGFDRPDRAVVATELVGTSLASGGDGGEAWGSFANAAAANPHIKWHSNRRGYVVNSVSGGTWRADYREVPFVLKPGAPVTTRTSWRIEHGRGGATRA